MQSPEKVRKALEKQLNQQPDGQSLSQTGSPSASDTNPTDSSLLNHGPEQMTERPSTSTEPTSASSSSYSSFSGTSGQRSPSPAPTEDTAPTIDDDPFYLGIQAQQLHAAQRATESAAYVAIRTQQKFKDSDKRATQSLILAAALSTHESQPASSVSVDLNAESTLIIPDEELTAKTDPFILGAKAQQHRERGDYSSVFALATLRSQQRSNDSTKQCATVLAFVDRLLEDPAIKTASTEQKTAYYNQANLMMKAWPADIALSDRLAYFVPWLYFAHFYAPKEHRLDQIHVLRGNKANSYRAFLALLSEENSLFQQAVATLLTSTDTSGEQRMLVPESLTEMNHAFSRDGAFRQLYPQYNGTIPSLIALAAPAYYQANQHVIAEWFICEALRTQDDHLLLTQLQPFFNLAQQPTLGAATEASSSEAPSSTVVATLMRFIHIALTHRHMAAAKVLLNYLHFVSPSTRFDFPVITSVAEDSSLTVPVLITGSSSSSSSVIPDTSSSPDDTQALITAIIAEKVQFIRDLQAKIPGWNQDPDAVTKANAAQRLVDFIESFANRPDVPLFALLRTWITCSPADYTALTKHRNAVNAFAHSLFSFDWVQKSEFGKKLVGPSAAQQLIDPVHDDLIRDNPLYAFALQVQTQFSPALPRASVSSSSSTSTIPNSSSTTLSGPDLVGSDNPLLTNDQPFVLGDDDTSAASSTPPVTTPVPIPSTLPSHNPPSSPSSSAKLLSSSPKSTLYSSSPTTGLTLPATPAGQIPSPNPAQPEPPLSQSPQLSSSPK